MTVREFVAAARASLSAVYDGREAEAIVSRLCEEVLGIRSYEWMLDPSRAVPDNLVGSLSAAVERLCRFEPLQYVIGHCDFCGFRLNVGPSVLIPRPETEELCCMILDRLAGRRNLRILDLCTGSGCIAWTLALSLPGSEVIGVDVSEEALRTARSQPLADEASGRGALVPRFVRHDVLSGPDGFPEGGFDVIVSNPPYVRESERSMMSRNVTDYEPDLAIFVPDDDPLIFFRAIADFARKRLFPGGQCFVEANEALEGPTTAIFSSENFSKVEPVSDFRTKFRFIFLEK